MRRPDGHGGFVRADLASWLCVPGFRPVCLSPCHWFSSRRQSGPVRLQRTGREPRGSLGQCDVAPREAPGAFGFTDRRCPGPLGCCLSASSAPARFETAATPARRSMSPSPARWRSVCLPPGLQRSFDCLLPLPQLPAFLHIPILWVIRCTGIEYNSPGLHSGYILIFGLGDVCPRLFPLPGRQA